MTKSAQSLLKLYEREKYAKEICAALNCFTDIKSILKTVVLKIEELTNCEAVGIRLYDDGDYPYFTYAGFPARFIEKENSLCQRDARGKRILFENEYLLECMCGNIIRRRIDPSKSFFTRGGSFWSNHTSALLAGTTEEDRQSSTRNYCNSCGYESVALIPINSNGKVIGLVQLNDKRQNMFTEDLIEYLEMVGRQIGLAVQNGWAYSKLAESREVIKAKSTLEKLQTEFLINMSHEFKFPLTNILSICQSFGPEHGGALLKNDVVKMNAYQLLRLVNNLLDITRIEANDFKLNIRGTNIVSLMNETVCAANEFLAGTGYSLVLSCELHSAHILCDLRQIKRVILNLISNAVKFSEPGEIFINVIQKKDRGFIEIDVTDRGIGIHPEKLPHIFDRFSHTAEDYKSGATGSGIGLALAKSIVELHGGDVLVNATPGAGSTFRVRLPMSEYLCSFPSFAFSYEEGYDIIKVELSDLLNIFRNIGLPRGGKNGGDLEINDRG